MRRLLARAVVGGVLGAAGLQAPAVESAQPAATATATAAPASQAVVVSDAWARATAPGMSVGAVYLTLQGGPTADTLLAASTPRAAMTQIHVVTEADGIARMRETEAVDVPAGQRVRLAPQGTHVMLMGLSQPLVAGERFALTLQFAKAGTREVRVQVVAPGAEPPPSN
jgi:copper(I)-binding protein